MDANATDRMLALGENMRRADWTLLAVSAAGGRGLTPVQLQKSLFVLGRELPGDVGRSFYSFVPYDYGPFDSDIYRDARDLEAEGLVSIVDDGSGVRTYSPTAAGLARAQQVKRDNSERIVSYLERVVRWTQSLSFGQLVQAIYKKYPDTSVNSVFGR